jgi:hypothetical protein
MFVLNCLIRRTSFFLDLVDELEPLNIQARYPEYKDKLFEATNEFHTKEILRKTRELFAWLQKKL